MLHQPQRPNPPVVQKQTTLVNARVDVQTTPDGGALLIFTLANEQFVVPLDENARRVVGTGLMAPGIVSANGNGH